MPFRHFAITLKGAGLGQHVAAELRRGKPGLSSRNAEDVHKTGSCFIKVECTSCFLALLLTGQLWRGFVCEEMNLTALGCVLSSLFRWAYSVHREIVMLLIDPKCFEVCSFL